jgi:hypothetical protein
LVENKSAEPDFPEKRSSVCPECTRLWNAYAVATREHVAAILAKEASTPTDDIAKMKILNDEALEAAHRRALARKAVRDHASTHAG